MPKLSDNSLKKKANDIRKDVIKICVKNGAGHIAPSLSSIDILVALYYSVMNISADPNWVNRDRLVFSKAHGAYGLYAILSDIGYIERKDWEGFYKGSFLPGCVERDLLHGIEAGTGALGHGLPMAAGIAFGAKFQKKLYKVYCIVGDGEMQEGSNWEALQFAVKHELSNLTVIIDRNRLQAMDFLENVLTVKGRERDLEMKLKAFGCNVFLCDGHKPEIMANLIKKSVKRAGKKTNVIIADTIKGCGLKCMENVPKFHFRIPTQDEMMKGGI